MPERADVFQMRLGLGLDRLGHGVQNIGGLVNPAPLNPGHAINLVQCGPKPHGFVADGQLGCDIKPAVLQVHQQLAPALGAFAKPVDQAQNILVAPFVHCPAMVCLQTMRGGPDNHQHTLAILVHAGRKVDAIRPKIHIAPRRKVPLGPAFVIIPPVRLQPGDGAGRRARRFRSQECSQGFREISRGNALEVKPRQQVLDQLRPPQIERVALNLIQIECNPRQASHSECCELHRIR